MAGVLRECLSTLTYLNNAAFVTCAHGRATIEVTQNGYYSVMYDGGQWCTFNKSEVDRLLGYLGEITGIATLNHETDEEAVLF